ncbi:MAG: hypothetical protein Kow006_14010 [Gammaproteobacteria bacterium]
MRLGQRAQATRRYTADDVAAFRELAGAPAGPDGRVPEPLIGALFSYLLGAELPGYGTNYLKQEMRFVRPARVGEPLTASVEITRLRPEKALVDLATRCVDAEGRPVCEGRALVLVRDVGGASS